MQTATNPATGEKIMWNGTAWVPMTSAAPAAAPGVVTLGTPRPKPPEVRQVGNQLGVVDPQTGGFTPTYTAPEKPDKKDTTPGDIDAQAKGRIDAVSAFYAAKAMRARLKEMKLLFEAGPGKTKGLEGVKDFVATPEMDAFNKIGNTVRGQVGQLLGFTGGQLNAVKEAELAVGPYLPSSSDWDSTALNKMSYLEQLADEAEARSIAILGGVPDELGNILPPDPPKMPAPPPRVTDAGGVTVEPQRTGDVRGKRLKSDEDLAAFYRTKPSAEQINDWFSRRGFPGISNATEVSDALREGRSVSSLVDYSLVDAAARKEADELRRQQDAGRITDNPVETLVGQGASLGLRDEAAGIAQGGISLLSGRDPVAGYRTGRDAERLRVEDARKQLGYGGTALEIAGGFVSANPTSALAPLLSRADTLRQGARAGAYGGALAGYGYGEGAGGSIGGAIAGGVGGAALGAAVPLAASRFRRLGAEPRGLDPDAAAAAQAEGVDLIRPMIDQRSRGRMGALESASGSQPIIRAGVDRVEGQIEGRVQALGQGGRALEPAAAGERLQIAGNRYIQRSGGVTRRLYDRARNLAGDVTVAPTNAVARIDAEIAELQTLPNVNQGEIGLMQSLREDLTRAPLTVDTVRNLRTTVRGMIGQQNLTMTQAEARAARVIEAATDDLTAALPPEAARAFRRADAVYRERMAVVDDLKKAILGNRGDPMDAQQAFRNVKALTAPGANGRRLAAVMRNLDPEERLDIAATVASALGRDASGAFSPARFVTATSNGKFSPSALRTVFGPDGAASVANLRTLSDRLTRAQGDVNRSRSGTTVAQLARRFVASLTGLGGAGYAAGGGTGLGVAAAATAGVMGASLARNVLSARALMNPRVSRWLAQSADVTTQAQAQQQARRLNSIIAREPALASELNPISQALQQRLAQPLAAEPNEAAQPDNG